MFCFLAIPWRPNTLLPLNEEYHLWWELFCPSGTLSWWVKGWDSNTKCQARESPCILVLPLLPSEINMFPSQGTCKFFWLPLTFGWIPTVHIHNGRFPRCLNEPERLCLLWMGAFNPIYGTLYQPEIASVRSFSWTTMRFTATAEELAGWLQRAMSTNHTLLKYLLSLQSWPEEESVVHLKISVCSFIQRTSSLYNVERWASELRAKAVILAIAELVTAVQTGSFPWYIHTSAR